MIESNGFKEHQKFKQRAAQFRLEELLSHQQTAAGDTEEETETFVREEFDKQSDRASLNATLYVQTLIDKTSAVSRNKQSTEGAKSLQLPSIMTRERTGSDYESMMMGIKDT